VSFEIFTIGHGARTLDDLVATLASAQVNLLVDVRRFPGSRRHPHLGRPSLERALPQLDIEYLFAGEALGGRREPSDTSRHPMLRVDAFRGYADHMDTHAFRSALGDLEDRARHGRRLAIMCAETPWWKCHRRLISDALVVDSFVVTHLMTPTQREPHLPTPEMRVDHAGRPVYDGGAPALL